MKNIKKLIILIIIILIIVFGINFLKQSLTQDVKNVSIETPESTKEKLERLIKNIKVTNIEQEEENVEIQTENLESELPDISRYPLSVEGKGEINIEMFSSQIEENNCLNEIVKNFNSQNYMIEGKKISISVRNIPSKLAMDYIISGKYVPDIYVPTNELCGEIIKQNNVNVVMATNRLIGNVAGIVLQKDKYSEFVGKYGAVNMETITTASINKELEIIYENPFTSPIGMNFLISALCAFDKENPVSENSIQKFELFQENISFVAYNDVQMKNTIKKEALESFIMEYQTYKNDKNLVNDYIFTPFGVRHDNPLYIIGELSNEKNEIARMFIDFAKSTVSQTIASDYGFNELDDYSKAESLNISGELILKAQEIWKEEKENGKPVIAVFVTDISASMAGEPIEQLKKSLINATKYIDNRNSIGLVSYNSDVYINLPIKTFDSVQKEAFIKATQKLEAKGGTATFNAMIVGLNMLLEAKQNVPDAELKMFLLSDGETNTGYNFNDIEEILEVLKIPVCTIGYNANISALQTISKINKSASINADSDDVIYQLKNLFNFEM